MWNGGVGDRASQRGFKFMQTRQIFFFTLFLSEFSSFQLLLFPSHSLDSHHLNPFTSNDVS
jgi:hypothetical protein